MDFFYSIKNINKINLPLPSEKEKNMKRKLWFTLFMNKIIINLKLLLLYLQIFYIIRRYLSDIII